MDESLKVFTIGFTQKSAEKFFGLLKSAGIRTLIDTRLNNTGQLSGFAKKDDLAYFCGQIAGVKYEHWLEAAPTDDALKQYKSKKITWGDYEEKYLELLRKRHIESSRYVEMLDHGCLLCSEAKPHFCHRRLLAEYLSSELKTIVQVKHLV